MVVIQKSTRQYQPVNSHDLVIYENPVSMGLLPDT